MSHLTLRRTEPREDLRRHQPTPNTRPHPTTQFRQIEKLGNVQ